MIRRRIRLVVNGERIERDVPPSMTLLRFLREELHLTGVKSGCGNGECGACTVLIDSKPVRSCLVLAVETNATAVTTIEGLARSEELTPIQQAFIDEDAIQCGFCSPGFIIAAYALLQEHPHPTESQILRALGGHLCRCTGYAAIFKAVRRAAETI
jgi:carbon-monoxide dehydrogenase small subunit